MFSLELGKDFPEFVIDDAITTATTTTTTKRKRTDCKIADFLQQIILRKDVLIQNRFVAVVF